MDGEVLSQPIPKWGLPTWVAFCLHMATKSCSHMFLKTCDMWISEAERWDRDLKQNSFWANGDFTLYPLSNFSADFNIQIDNENRFRGRFGRQSSPYTQSWFNPRYCLIIGDITYHWSTDSSDGLGENRPRRVNWWRWRKPQRQAEYILR